MIVDGLGSIGYRVALGIAARGVPVVAVEVSDDGRFVSPTRAAGIPVFIGDARHPEVLEQLHLDSARAIVAATSDDLVNMSAALNARALRPDLSRRRPSVRSGLRGPRPTRVQIRFDPERVAARPPRLLRRRPSAPRSSPPFRSSDRRVDPVRSPDASRRIAARGPAVALSPGGSAADPGSEDARWDFPPTRSWTPARKSSWRPPGPVLATCSTSRQPAQTQPRTPHEQFRR